MNPTGLIERFFDCPYCWERISVLVDNTAREQSYIEDCEVCCRPIDININLDVDGQILLEASRAD